MMEKERDPTAVAVEPQKKKKRGEGKMPAGPSTKELEEAGRGSGRRERGKEGLKPILTTPPGV